MYDDLALLLLRPRWLRLRGVQGAELEMRQVGVGSMFRRLSVFRVLLVKESCYAQTERLGLRPAAVCQRGVVWRGRCEVP